MKLSLVPLLLRPRLIAAKNRWQHGAATSNRLRDYIILLFAVSIMFGIYYGCMRALGYAEQNAHLAYIPVQVPLALFMLFLFGMLLFSNTVNAFGALFLAKDMELVLSSPLRRGAFFWGKFCEILFSSSWMALVFALPAIIAFGISYSAGPEFYLLFTLGAIPFFMIPSAIAVLIVTIFTTLVPISRTRELLFVVCIVFLACIYGVIQLVSPQEGVKSGLNDVLRLIALISSPSKDWLPSYWFAQVLSAQLEPTAHSVRIYFVALLGAAIGTTAVSYLVSEISHFGAYSRSKSISQSASRNSRRSNLWFTKLLAWVDQPQRALAIKEYKSFTRDITQTIQVLLLLGICAIYLYNFTLVRTLDDIPLESRMWWRAFLLVTNLTMADFLITAACTRFVFPSVSLEGPSYWIIQTTPLSIQQLLKAKFWFWFFPIALVSAVVFIAGAYALRTDLFVISLTVTASTLTCYGIVGLAIGFGAVFSNFEWEHASQLAASFGSLVFMLISTLLIAAAIIPTITLVFSRDFILNRPYGHYEWYLWSVANIAVLYYLNSKVTELSLRFGEKALRKRME